MHYNSLSYFDDIVLVTDVNECEDSNNGCDGQCINTEGGYDCQCTSGRVWSADNRTCEGINS